MIRMKSGVYGARNVLKRASDGPFSLSDKEEARLVNRGVAEYVYEHQPTASDDVPTIPRYDIGMTEKQLRGIAAYFRVDVSTAKKKQDIVDLLDAHFGAEDGEEPDEEDGSAGDPGTEDPDVPALGAEDPTA